MKQLLKSLMARTPYRLVRNYGINRFQAIDQTLQSMRKQGYRPKIVIDGGANVGQFSVAAQTIFPEATFHLIEPQPPCIPLLRELCAKRNFVLHEFALSNHAGAVEFLKTEAPSTGAYVNPSHRGQEAITVPANTIDALFADQITAAMRGLLKLDIQGHELAALNGGIKVLESIEAVLIEVMFLPFGPPIPRLVEFFDHHGFDLYDVASLAARTRDNRLSGGDLIFARRSSGLMADLAGE